MRPTAIEGLTTPAVSVLIAAYNAEATLADALDSLLAQSRADWEAVVADDGSTDSTAAIAAEYAARDPRISVVSKINGGTASARNAAARVASAPLLALLDSDDQYTPGFLDRVGEFVDQHPGFDIYSVDAFLLGGCGHLEPDTLHPDSLIRSFVADDLLVTNRIRVYGVFRRSVFDLLGGFDEDPRCAMEDYDFWLRALLAGARHIHLPERLAVYRQSATTKTADALAGSESNVYMFRKLIRSGVLSRIQLRIARSSLRRWVRAAELVRFAPIRSELESGLRRGDTAGARALYLRSRRGWVSQVKWALGLPVMLASPRVFARVLPKVTANDKVGQ